MSYFKELPNIQYTANFPDQSFNTDTVDVKNLFRRARLREDIANAVTAFNYYQIKDGERPDALAKKLYNDEELDWVILITNNITDITEQWPLDNNTLYKHLIDKYGSEEALSELNHFVSLETREEYNRLLIQGDLGIDDAVVKPDPFKTVEDANQYTITSFPIINETDVSVNLNQYVSVFSSQETKLFDHSVTDINVSKKNVGISTSKLYINGRNSTEIPITINNDLTKWASSWGGSLTVSLRDQNINVSVGDTVGTVNAQIPSYLYSISKSGGNPTFSFNPSTTYPFPGVTVSFATQTFGIDFLNSSNVVERKLDRFKEISNYEYEVQLNEKKRQILILKPEYLSVFVSDLRNIMKYTPSSQYIDQSTIQSYNPKLSGM